MMISNKVDGEGVPLAFDIFETNEVHASNPIILIHGLFWNKFMFKELGLQLCKETKRTVYSLDLRCHGQSPFREKCSSLLMTEDVKKFLSDHSLKRVSFVCHSFSSTIPYLIALDEPELVEKIVMIDHPPFPDFSEKFLKENVWPQFNGQNRFLTTLSPSLSLMEAKTKISNLCPYATKGQAAFLKKVAYELEKESKFKWKTDIQFLMDKYAEKAFTVKSRGYLNHNILIIRCVNSNRVSDLKFKEVKKYNPNAKLETIEDTTHLLMFEKTDVFLDLVKIFLESKSQE